MATFFRQIIWLFQFKDLTCAQKNREMKKWQKKAIEEIMDNFDFKKVRKAMLALDWRWMDIDRVPFVSELREEAKRMLVDTTDKDENPYYLSSSGFDAVCDTEKKAMRLIFYVTEWESYKF